MLKVKYGKEIHYLKVGQNIVSLGELKDRIKGKFKKVPLSFYFTYKDEEDDEIMITNQQDLANAFDLYLPDRSQRSLNMIKLTIIEDQQIYIQENKVEENIQENSSQKSISQLISVEEKLIDSFELLNSSQNSNYQQLNGNSDDSIGSSSHNDSFFIQDQEISEIVQQNIKKIKQKVLQNVIKQAESNLIQCEINQYLGNLYESLQVKYSTDFQIEKQNNSIFSETNELKKENQENDEQELSQMIARSLKKILPSFIEQLSKNTIRSVKLLIEKQRNEKVQQKRKALRQFSEIRFN